MIITDFPFKFHCFRHQIFAYLVVDIGFVGLTELVAAAHTVHLAVLDEVGTRLVKAEEDAVSDALLTERKHPVVVAGPRVDARLATY